MGLGDVKSRDVDGNIGVEVINLSERVCGLLFDISAQTGFWESTHGIAAAAKLKDTVVELNSLQDAVDAGIAEYSELTTATAANYLLNGVAYYHIKHFFNRVGGSGRLFVMFADCSTNFNALIDMQRVAQGAISQIGVWTEKNLWKLDSAEDPTYQNDTMISDLNAVAVILADTYHAPCSIVLSPNTAKVKGASGTIDTVEVAKIPSVITSNRYVSVVLSQAKENNVSVMQQSLSSKTPVGILGCVLGSLSAMNVAHSIGWVEQNEVTDFFADIEFGFGDVSLAGTELKNTTPYAALTMNELNGLDDKGYIFLCRYAGYEGRTFISGDQTCSDGDYRTISRNRVIGKSRRFVRAALLPYVNSPIKVDPATGQLSAAQITVFNNLVQGVLDAMESEEEISGTGSVVIPANQNILKNDQLRISYSIVPMGTAKEIIVNEGFTTNSQA